MVLVAVCGRMVSAALMSQTAGMASNTRKEHGSMVKAIARVVVGGYNRRAYEIIACKERPDCEGITFNALAHVTTCIGSYVNVTFCPDDQFAREVVS